MSKDCKVRYIITVNALKEGWDCPFAYVLASLANKSSSVDVEQILGRVLRLPYVTKHQQELLNYSYVFTSSTNFLSTLDKIILGLNKSGFSAKDYRVNEKQLEPKESKIDDSGSFEDLFGKAQSTENSNDTSGITEVEINPNEIKELSQTEKSKEQLNDILDLAYTTNTEFEKKIEELEKDDNLIPSELKDKIKSYEIKETFRKEAKDVVLPSFFIKTTPSLIEEENYVALSKGLLLKGFDLDKEESKIELTRTASQMYRVDLTEIRANESVPEYRKERENVKDAFIKYISTLSPEAKINQIAGRLNKIIKHIDEIPEPQIIAYIKKILEPLDSDKIAEIANNEIVYADIFKKRIKELASSYAEKQFIRMLDKGSVVCKPTFKFPNRISPKNTVQGITKNLYIEEGEINPFEKKVINEVANLDSVVFWHRNLERGKGFQLNGFINHYPDFIVKMKNGKTILIETKGDHLDGSDSQQKLSLGEKWASKAGDNYRYFMVFESDKLEGARTIAELIDILKDMK